MARLFDDASSQYLEITTVPVTAYPFSMACWFNSDSITLNQILIAFALSTATNVYYHLVAAGAVIGDPISAGASNTTERRADTTTGYSANTWNHACGVWTSDTLRAAYLNGGSKGTNTQSVTFNTSVNRTAIGRLPRSSPSAYMSGSIAEAAIWNVALSDAEVAILARGISSLMIRPANIVGYWRIGVASPEPDWSKNVNNMAVTGATIANHCRVMPLILDGRYGRYYVVPPLGPSIPVVMKHYRDLRV